MAERSYFSRPRRRRRTLTRVVVGLAIVVLVAAVAAGAYLVVGNRNGPPPLPAAEVDGFLRAWQAGDAFAMSRLVEHAPADLESTAFSLVKAAPGSKATYTRTSLVRAGDNATATYHARVDIPALGPIEWDGHFDVLRLQAGNEKVWRIGWRPDILYPGLASGQRLSVRRTWPPRASILAADGSVLAGTGAVVTIGIEPDRVTTSLPQIKQLMQQLVGTDPATIDAALRTPGIRPNYFVPIATVPDDARYQQVLRPKLYPVPGVFFHRGQGVVGGAGGVDALVGRVGEVTAERLKQLGAPYKAGDEVGLSGLQAAYERRLAGTPSIDVVVENAKTAKTVRRVRHHAGSAGQTVRLTIDPKIQSAADAALAGVAQPAALVAIDAPTGKLLAVVSKPDGGFNRALAGTYPPGSTFKVVTSAALLAAGRTASTPAPCPATLTVDGRVFHNFEGEASGALDLAQAFKISCNNAFIGLGDQLPIDALASTAARFGFNSGWSLPVPSYAGSYPRPRDRAELGESAIGQGRVLASPAQMASVAAAVAAGQWHSPVLTTQPAPDAKTSAALDAGVLATLRSFMASVPQTGGTAAGAGLPPGVLGKTGTAEFGTGNPPPTHAWFIGYRGNLAFAVVVEGGGVGGRVAAPLAAKFLNALP